MQYGIYFPEKRNKFRPRGRTYTPTRKTTYVRNNKALYIIIKPCTFYRHGQFNNGEFPIHLHVENLDSEIFIFKQAAELAVTLARRTGCSLVFRLTEILVPVTMVH